MVETADPKIKTKTTPKIDRVWKTIVWNDPINTMTFVEYVFQKVIQMSKEEASKKMLEVHNGGSSIVYTGNKEKAEYYTHQLQSYRLTSSMEQDT